MNIFYPHYNFSRIDRIPVNFFKKRGIDTLLLDVDNTLTGDNEKEPIEAINMWLDTQKKLGINLFIMSNNTEERVKPFAEKLGLGYIADAKKPSCKKIKQKLEEFGSTPQKTAVIGDQIFTDILAGRLAGCTAVRVEPMALENYGFYIVKRRLEKPIIKSYNRYIERQKKKNNKREKDVL